MIQHIYDSGIVKSLDKEREVGVSTTESSLRVVENTPAVGGKKVDDGPSGGH